MVWYNDVQKCGKPVSLGTHLTKKTTLMSSCVIDVQKMQIIQNIKLVEYFR